MIAVRAGNLGPELSPLSMVSSSDPKSQYFTPKLVGEAVEELAATHPSVEDADQMLGFVATSFTVSLDKENWIELSERSHNLLAEQMRAQLEIRS